jgi:hypothetical protein
MLSLRPDCCSREKTLSKCLSWSCSDLLCTRMSSIKVTVLSTSMRTLSISLEKLAGDPWSPIGAILHWN